MDELIQQVTQRTGLAPDKARTAVDTVLGFLKNKLPGPVAGQLENALSSKGDGPAESGKQMGGIFGQL